MIENATAEQLLKSIGAKVSQDIKARIRNNMVKPATEKNSGKTLSESTRLMRSITYHVEGDTVIVGTNVVYARIHHEGGVIKPKRAKYLAIPLTKEAAVMKPRDWTDTWIKLGIIMHKGADGEPEALYCLVKSVTIPARPYMFIDDKTMKSIVPLIRQYMDARFPGKNRS